MKKIYLSVVALCFAMSAMAQVQVGPKLGLNLNKIADGEKTSEGIRKPFKTGINIGAAFSFPLNENVAIAPEFTYSQKGGKAIIESVDFSYAQTFNYIDMPVLVRASFGDLTKGYFNAGPTFGYWLGGRVKTSSNDNDVSIDARIVFVDESDNIEEDQTPYPKKYVNRMEVGLAIGGGVMFDTESGDFLLDLRYNAGLTNLFGEEIRDAVGRYKNSGLSLSVIYLFDTN